MGHGALFVLHATLAPPLTPVQTQFVVLPHPLLTRLIGDPMAHCPVVALHEPVVPHD